MWGGTERDVGRLRARIHPRPLVRDPERLAQGSAPQFPGLREEGNGAHRMRCHQDRVSYKAEGLRVALGQDSE